jgi:hypothetical protein
VVDKQAHERNTRLLMLLVAGTMYELGAALQSLCSTKVFLKVKDPASWEPLDKLRAQWNTNYYARTIRNEFSHHLGEMPTFLEGIAHEDAPSPAVLYTRRSQHRFAGQLLEPWNALFRAKKISDADMRTFIRKTREGFETLPELLFAFFGELLQSCGIEVRNTKVEPNA